MFSTLPKTNFNFSVTFILLSASAFNLDQSKNLLYGKELIVQVALLIANIYSEFQVYMFSNCRNMTKCHSVYMTTLKMQKPRLQQYLGFSLKTAKLTKCILINPGAFQFVTYNYCISCMIRWQGAWKLVQGCGESCCPEPKVT